MKINNKSGLSVDFLENGCVKSIDVAPIRIGVKPVGLFSKPGTILYLRIRTQPYRFTELLGPESPGKFKISENTFIAKGNWSGLEYSCVLQLSGKSLSWQWSIEVRNKSGEPVEADLFYVQDAGLKPITSGLNNEYYISQYLERRIMNDNTFGSVICCRQNMKESTGNPWLMIACKNKAVSASVDGMQFYGKTYRETGIPVGLLSDFLHGEYAGESTVLVLQNIPFTLNPGENHQCDFVATYLPDHPLATAESDTEKLTELIREFPVKLKDIDVSGLISPAKSIFNTSAFLPVEDLNEKELFGFFGKKRRHVEEQDGQLLSFFCDKFNHVVLRTKELLTDRPHAHIMQTKTGYTADENIMSTTSFAYGVFNSHLTQGNTNFNTLLSVCSSPFNLAIETGQRIFVDLDGKKFLLGVPSAFEMGLNHCRWIYKHEDHCFQVRTWTSKKSPQINMDFKVLEGSTVGLIITHQFDNLNGWRVSQGNSPAEFVVKPKTGSMISEKFPDSQFRINVHNSKSTFNVSGDESLYPAKKNEDDPLFVLNISKTNSFALSFIGEVCKPSILSEFIDVDSMFASDCRDARNDFRELLLNLHLDGEQDDTAAIQEILPWYSMNALTHFLTPYGLEQFSGAAWGTRDVSQGPFDLLLCMQKYDAAKQLLRKIFSNQNPDGGWPQWWMFDSYTSIRADHSHGDVFYWCIIALADYIKVTGDLAFLSEVLPYYSEKGVANAEKTILSEHLDRLINMIITSFIPGTSLVPYGAGDWNDSLQPVSKDLAQRMISSWTVEMNYQAFMQYLQVYKLMGNTEKAKALRDICLRIKTDFNKHLVKDGVVAGYGLVEKDKSIRLLLHPGDTETNIRYSILPMNRGIISGIFTKEQALFHQDLIEDHLKGPDGARLMDRPLKYKGGIQTFFQRAESSTFFGREIGLMYVHEHIRYAESQAITGRAEAFVKALRQAIPVGYRDIVKCGDIRQSNCYYSSSDVSFRNRYEADELYDKIKTGKITTKGGWRVYSSGPGIFISLIVTRFLGIRMGYGNIFIDPVIPKTLNGLTASVDFLGHHLKLIYRVKNNEYSPKEIRLNDKAIDFRYEDNIYRQGGAVFPASNFTRLLNRTDNTLEIIL